MWKRAVIESVVIVVIATACAMATKTFHPLAPALYLQNEPLRDDEVTLELVSERWGEEVIWIDARQQDAYEAGHIEGAFLLNKQGWTDQLWEIWTVLESATKPVVVYCDSGGCKASREVADRLRSTTPLEDVYVLRGGWDGYSGRSSVRQGN